MLARIVNGFFECSGSRRQVAPDFPNLGLAGAARGRDQRAPALSDQIACEVDRAPLGATLVERRQDLEDRGRAALARRLLHPDSIGDVVHACATKGQRAARRALAPSVPCHQLVRCYHEFRVEQTGFTP